MKQMDRRMNGEFVRMNKIDGGLINEGMDGWMNGWMDG